MGVKLFCAASLSFCVVLIIQLQTTTALPIAKPNCTDHCGNIRIPYPFGMGKEYCYFNKSYEIECNKSTINSPPRAFIKSINMEVLNISINGTATIKGPIFKNCSGSMNIGAPINLTGTPFVLSSRNYLIGVGCNTRVLIKNSMSQFYGCETTCDGEKPNQDARGSYVRVLSNEYRCTGYNCCQTSIYSLSQVFDPQLLQTKDDSLQGKYGCKLAFVALDEWISSSEFTDPYTVQRMEYVPFKLTWMMKSSDLTWKYDSMSCDRYWMTNSSDDIIATECSCADGYEYESNPYLGCIDIDECKAPKKHRLCQGIMKCVNTNGWYKCEVDPKWIVIIVLGAIIGALALLFGTWRLYKLVMRKRKIELRKKFFKRNGGLLLQQQLTSNDGSVQSTRIFTSKELEKATDRFNENRILGQGGQGTVYKGMLPDGRIVAVKKSLLIDEEMLQEFINEVVILSQINHRNVVNLLGCCLETEVPLLVYEFIPNGSLFQLLHNQLKEEVFLSWDMRLQIAIESAGALAYLHSAATIPIYHRDIKSTNILLDEKFRAKVSDFGTSRSITIEQTHLTTRVIGTMGYLDPEYFQSSQFTDKSDVYSFGVVLVELLSGQKPFCVGKTEETRSLATYFILLMEEYKLFDIVDTRIMEVCHEKEIVAIANLAKQCLNLNGRQRPTMKEVAIELEGIRTARSKLNVQQVSEETKDTLPVTMSDAMPFPTLVSCEFDNVEAPSFEAEPLIPIKICD